MKCAFLFWALSTVAALADNSTLTAGEILGQTVATYRNCNCYEDSGVVETVFDSKGRISTNTKPFEIHFSRPALFRFEFTQQFFPGAPTEKYVLWSDGTQTHTYWQSADSYWANESLSKGVAGMTGVSGSAARSVPSLLIDSIEGVSLAELGNLALLREEVFEGASCYVIDGHYSYPDRRCELWIGKDDFLLRKKKERHQLPDDTVTVTEEIHRLIKIDQDVPDTVFSFVPPEGTKLVEGIESALTNSARQLAEAQARAEAINAAARQHELDRIRVFRIDCQADGVTITPGGTKTSLGDLGHANNPLEKMLDSVTTNRSFDRIFVLIHPGSMATYRAVRGAVGNRPITVQYEPAEDDSCGAQGSSDGKTNRIVVTSGIRVRSPVSAGKRPVYVECCDNQVYLVDRNGQAEAPGISLEELAAPYGRLLAALMHLDRRTQYVSFLVTDDSFPVFRKARDVTERWAYDTSWELIGVGEPIQLDAGSTQSR